MDGDGVLFGSLQGQVKTTLAAKSENLPKKHNKGGQSANRFERQREEKCKAYISKVAEAATLHFISNNMPNVKGLILAGRASNKNELNNSDKFDPRLKAIVRGIFDLSYGQEKGFEEAIGMAAETLQNVQFV